MDFDAIMTQVVALGAPVLCADTCSILDVMRDPTRDEAQLQNASAAIDLVTKMGVIGGFECLIAHQVTKELADHLEPVQEETKKQLAKLTERIKRVNAIAALFGPKATLNLAHLLGHEVRARGIVDQWIGAAKVINPNHDLIAGRAFARVSVPKAPAKQGKDSIKDCVVIETYLDAVRTLRAAGLSSKIVFLSSNTKDYTNNQTNKLHDDLSPEFQTLNIEYAPNAGAAKYLLGL
ncbi:PIN domain-containing protein [Herbaspirillum sp. NPDC087042]|uniref:PIN domain-containing protein n=1 Tax=Herbaspirillum sp. NPDC087042 TaxID=3364004 RepID=UPI00381612E6